MRKFALAALLILIAILLVVNNKNSNIVKNDGLSLQNVSEIVKCGADQKCMDAATESLLKLKTTKQLLLELDELGKRDRKVQIDCHIFTHSIGRMTYKKALESEGSVSDAFQDCDHTCHSGCFHGIMERVFQSGEDDVHVITTKILREKSPNVCESFAYGSRGNLKFQCLHGLEHAVLFFHDYDLIEGLKTCDTLKEEWDRRSCYGGLFMENIHASNSSKRYLNSDYHFPCNAIDEKYQNDCYLMQTTRMAELGLNHEQIGNECEKAGEQRSICMQSLGRDGSSNTRTDPKSLPICTQLETETDRQYCITGVVYALADYSWSGKYGFPYCDALPNDYTNYCYQTIISYLKNSLFIREGEVIDSCNSFSTYPNCASIAESN